MGAGHGVIGPIFLLFGGGDGPNWAGQDGGRGLEPSRCNNDVEGNWIDRDHGGGGFARAEPGDAGGGAAAWVDGRAG